MQVSENEPDCQDGDDGDRLEILRAGLTTYDEAADVSELFRLLGEPTRLRILSALVKAGELSVGSIAEVVETTETKVSQALRLLRSSDVVSNRRAGRTVFYRLADDNVRVMLGLSLEHVNHAAADRSSLIGAVERISTAPDHGDPLVVLDDVEAIPGVGLAGDRPGASAARQVSIQSRAELALAEKRLGRPILADQTRRNITIDTGELPRARGQRIFLGDVELEVFSDAAPCAVMTKAIGKGARPALKRLAGIHCRVITGGAIQVGDDLLLGRAPDAG